MPQKTYLLEGVGEVTLFKRRGTSSLRLSFDRHNQPRLNMPYYLPYSVGMEFIKSKKQWILAHKKPTKEYASGDLIGKSVRLSLIPASAFKTRLSESTLEVLLPEGASINSYKLAVDKAIEKSLRTQSERLLLPRLEELSKRLGYEYRSAKIKKLRSRWGSCNSKQEISLSLYLIQIPWELIDYVLIHELVHTKHMHHQKPFWDEMRKSIPRLSEKRKMIRKFAPQLINS